MGRMRAYGSLAAIAVLALAAVCRGQAELSQRLFQQARAGNAAAVRDLLARGADPNVRDQTRSTPLMYAAEEGRGEVVRALLERGAEVDAVDEDGETALMYAAGGNDLAVVRMLLDKGANVNARSDPGQSPLDIAAAKGTPEVVSLLISRGAELNGGNLSHQTPAAFAAMAHRKDNLQLLLSAGAPLDLATLIGPEQSSDDADPAGARAYLMNWRCVRLAGGKNWTEGQGPFDQLVQLIYRGDEEGVKKLLARKEFNDFYILTYAGLIAEDDGRVGILNVIQRANEPLVQARQRDEGRRARAAAAATSGDVDEIRAALAAGLLTDAALMRDCVCNAAKQGHLRIVRVLLAAGGNINDALAAAGDGDAQRREIADAMLAEAPATWKPADEALLAWAKVGAPEVVRKLVLSGANVNARGFQGITPLMLAAQSGDLAMVTLLVGKGAKLDAKTSQGRTALSIAESEVRADVVRFLAERGASSGTRYNPLAETDMRLPIERIRELLDAGAAPDAVNRVGEPILHIALLSARTEAVRLLIAHGAVVGKGAVTQAVLGGLQEGDFSIIQLLIDKGGNINEARREDGQTPLMLATERQGPALVQWLIDHGANVSAKDPNGRTALDIAVSAGKDKSAAILRAAAGKGH